MQLKNSNKFSGSTHPNADGKLMLLNLLGVDLWIDRSLGEKSQIFPGQKEQNLLGVDLWTDKKIYLE